MPTLTLTLVMVIELGTLIVLVVPVVLLSGIAAAGEDEKVRTWLVPPLHALVGGIHLFQATDATLALPEASVLTVPL